MKNNSPTHVFFDGKQIIISSNLRPVFDFLKNIDKEIESFLGFSEKLESIRKQYLETLKFIEVLSKKLKENSIDFSFTLSEHPETMADKLKIDRPIRSEMIILFAYLEVLFCLDIAYEEKTSDKNEIKEYAMNPSRVRNFYDKFCLTQENRWSQKNPERLKHITANDLRLMTKMKLKSTR